MIRSVQIKVNQITNDLGEVEENQYKGLRTLDAHNDTMRIKDLMKKFPGDTPEEIAQKHVEDCLVRDHWYKFEKVWN